MKRLTSIGHSLLPGLSLLLVLVIWEAAVRMNNIPVWLLPAPSRVISTIIEIWPLLVFHSTATLLETGYGFLFSIFLALFIGLLLDHVSVLKHAVNPILVISQTIPLIVLAVLMPLWFGWGMLPKVLIVMLVCFFPITINLMKGLDSADPDQLSLFRSMGAGRWETFKIVKFPAALPAFFSGLKISATYSIMAAVISEWVGAQRGLGYFMTIQQKSFAIDKVLAAVIIICILSLLLVKLVDVIEYVLVPWDRPTVSDSNI
ncbi:hydroxymethylpyrimidine abc transporter, transmembrane component [hydrocarbon metagenome]|uniref:Hydroxymethylpyrimidine abc transporter, transmembrane component n=1 Tax=hydrocarbon metagenome TaxID=938273 RepID=A0A0W8E8H7_9ZZZZ